MPRSSSVDDVPDDVDRLFARLQPAAVPSELTARVLAATVARDAPMRTVLAWPWMVAALGALAILTLAGYQLGVSLARTDGLELLSALTSDIGLLTTAPGDVAAALGEVVPWTLVLVAALGAGMLVLAASNVIARVPAWRPRQIA
jgi:hypothetical protein